MEPRGIKIIIEVATADQKDTILSTLTNAEEEGDIDFSFNTSVSRYTPNNDD